MSKKKIRELFNLGWSSDAIYHEVAGELQLYGVAFFGHKGSTIQKLTLRRQWNRIIEVEREIKNKQP